MTRVGWDSPLARAVGDKSARKLAKTLGMATVGDLLSHYPRRFVPRGEVSDVGDLVPGEQATFLARVVSVTEHQYRDRRTGRPAWRLEVVTALADGELAMTFFAPRRYLVPHHLEALRQDSVVLFSGRVERNRVRRRLELVNPHYAVEDLGRDHSALQPIYPVSGSLTSWDLENAVRVALDVLDTAPERVPAAVRTSRGLLDARTALRWVHRPDDRSQYGAATKRLRFDEALVAQVVLARRRAALADQPAVPRPGRDGGLLDRFDERLPFTLTDGQRQVSKRLAADLAETHPMHRLLQGEVGSGKTVVALRAMLRVVDSGGQAALLAPTEVLAQQHHRSVVTMLGDLAAGGMLGGADDGTQVALLTGSVTGAARRQALLDVASGAAGIVIGTHALLEEQVQFADLGLVVVDEQHRFGVEQRAALGAKTEGSRPHVLVMTATPIPRTVAMTVFGDLETSTLREVPAGRQPVQTTVVPLAEQPAWMGRVWMRAREEVAAGRQVYVVCPRIGDGDGAEDDPGSALDGGDGLLGDPELDGGYQERPPPRPAAVAEVASGIAEGPLQGLRVEALHGRLPPDRKDHLMRAFAAGGIDVLVSTTVIEVGVDVPNATMMVVLDADRFGVSQLHQLRGRVGRGGHPGLCLLVTSAEPESPARRRLESVAGTSDGFVLSQLDLEQRHEGDLLGSSQSGSRRTLRLLSVAHHVEVIEAARDVATALVSDDPALTGEPDLAAAVRALEETDAAEFLEKA
jgi:ATP-dependent DNA helicase RecG